jgi:hypothetical protein
MFSLNLAAFVASFPHISASAPSSALIYQWCIIVIGHPFNFQTHNKDG